MVGVAAGAMIDRVGDDVGRLGPVSDAAAMAANSVAVWNSDRAELGGRHSTSPIATVADLVSGRGH